MKGLPLQIAPSSLIFYMPLDDVAHGVGINTASFSDRSGNKHDGTGVDADGDSKAYGEEILSYP